MTKLSSDAVVSILSGNVLLAGLGAEDLRAFTEVLDEVRLESGATVVREGDVGDAMYFVLEGVVELRRGELELSRLNAGAHLGELALFGLRRRAATAVACGPVCLARLSRAAFDSLVRERSELAVALLRSFVDRLGDQLVGMTDNVGTLLRKRSLPRRTQVSVRGQGGVRVVPTGTPVRELLPALENGHQLVAALLDNKAVSLETALGADCTLYPLTLGHREGREIFRNGVGLLLLEAARRLAPDVVVRLGAGFGEGRVVHMARAWAGDAEATARALQSEMEAIVAEDLPFENELWSVDEARELFRERAWADAAALQRTRRSLHVKLVRCGGVYALESGPMVPSTGYLRGSRVHAHPHGLFLEYGEPVSRSQPRREDARGDVITQELTLPRFGGEMVLAHLRWLEAMGVHSAGAFNDLCISGQVSQVIRVAEGFHEKRLGRIADEIAARSDQVRVICIAGPSSSGKTTTIKRLTVQLEVNGLRPRSISLDDYYVDREKTPRDDAGEYDYESFDALRIDLLHSHLAKLLRGEAVHTARYDFKTGRSADDGGTEVRLEHGDVLLLEGIHGLNPQLLGDAVKPMQRFRIFIQPATALCFDRVSAMTPQDLRLLRRVVRDRHQRGLSAAENIARWDSVLRGEALHIFPFQTEADVIFDTSLVYEPSVLKVFADRYLLEVPEDHPSFPTAYRLRRLVDRFVTIYPDHVPPTSILREFIGGSGFEY
jgi:uridine kinase